MLSRSGKQHLADEDEELFRCGVVPKRLHNLLEFMGVDGAAIYS